MSFRRIAATVIAVAALGAGLLVPSGASAAAQCGRDSTFAKFIQPEGGQVSANTSLGGIAYTLPLSGAPTSVMLSLTGQIEVKIEYKCLLWMRLDVYKDGVAGPIHSNTWGLDCQSGVKTDTVNIGLDGGNYRFVLSGQGCDGVGLKPTEQGGLVGDPPLGL